MQSYLGPYKDAATNREEKILRAINSVITQSFKDWELIIIADGCEKTFDIVEANYGDNKQIDCFLVTKQTMWSGSARNFGISRATGEYIVYLDIDDYFGVDHLRTISDNLGGRDWVWFNDLVKTNTSAVERQAIITQRYQYGTSNLCHKRLLEARWTSVGYGQDDWSIGVHLLKLSKNYIKIPTPQYVVCHIPKQKLDL
jgi:glycosyltransferase involved in cell wall biosynthesis